MNAKSKEKNVIAKAKASQSLKNKSVTETTPPISLPIIPGTIKLNNIKGAKRILSRLISGFIKNEVSDSKAKTLCYLVTSYVTIVKDNDFENRLQLLESTLQGDK
jgi:hypothetical protein